MSQIALSNAERTEALRRFGYSGREAQFLVPAALHGGFFLRRQYCEFIGRQVGGTVAELVEKLLTNGHATSVAGCHNTKVYHLGARPFYAALGQENNRNRRERAPVVIKNKLMCLDFVLDHPGMHYLATEEEKVAYFRDSLGIATSDLPCKLFRSPTSREATARYFVDKYPIFVDASDTAPVVSFCFVDEGLATASRFELYLAQYRRLVVRLSACRVVYVAASELPFRAAKGAFESFVGGPKASVLDAHDEATIQCLLIYFEARRLYESRQLEAFDRAKLIRLRDDRERFSGPSYEALYRLWCAGGAAAVRQALAASSAPSGKILASFQTYLLKQNYNLFGGVSRIQKIGDQRQPTTPPAKTTVGADFRPDVGRGQPK